MRGFDHHQTLQEVSSKQDAVTLMVPKNNKVWNLTIKQTAGLHHIPNSYPDGDVTSQWHNRGEVVVVEATSVGDGQTAASVVTDLSPVIVHCFVTSLCSAEAEARSAPIPHILS